MLLAPIGGGHCEKTSATRTMQFYITFFRKHRYGVYSLDLLRTVSINIELTCGRYLSVVCTSYRITGIG